MKNIFCFKKLTTLFLASVILFSSCVSTTLIRTEPPGAKVFIDGSPAGVTPFSYSDTKIVGAVTNIRIEKEGYEPTYAVLTRDEQIDYGALVGGLFFYVPFLWIMKYEPFRTYHLTPLYDSNFQINNEDNEQISNSKYQKLRELKQLLDEGVITKEEFETEKQKILKQE